MGKLFALAEGAKKSHIPAIGQCHWDGDAVDGRTTWTLTGVFAGELKTGLVRVRRVAAAA
jgi:hypothetical protein